MKVTVLMENTAIDGFTAEHGLSLLIDHGGERILLDAGTTGKFAANAERSGIDLSSVDTAVLSHGHYDHSGGFDEFFKCNSTAKVWAREEVTGKYYSSGGGMHEIGVPVNVLAHCGRFAYISENTAISDGVHLIGHDTPDLSRIGEKTGLYKETDGQMYPDDFAHEQSLVIETERGLAIFNSCSHGGAANIIREAREHCGGQPVFAYVGGLHMKGKDPSGQEICAFSDSELDELCSVFRAENISRIYTGHCTGLAGLSKLRERLGERIIALTTGMTFEL